MNHIELFAGCGGLNLGLSEVGFKLLMANELSPMAAETFAYNFLGEDLEYLAAKNELPENTKWIASRYPELVNRLRENPFNFPELNAENEVFFSDLGTDANEFFGKLLVGPIEQLNAFVAQNDWLKDALRSGFDAEDGLSLVSGGPPCQSFSMAGQRDRHNHKNSLPWEFAKFVELTQPKIALLENVTGILRAFRDEEDGEYFAWYEVAKVFASIGYIPLCLHVNAKFVGAPQNRPRFLMIAIRGDHFENIKPRFNELENRLFESPLNFVQLVEKHGAALEYGHLVYIDMSKNSQDETLTSTFLQPFLTHFRVPVSVADAIGDLKIHDPDEPSPFLLNLNQMLNQHLTADLEHLTNHDFRNNSEHVKRRFRIYQILQEIGDNTIKKDVFNVLKGLNSTLDERSWHVLRQYLFYAENCALVRFQEQEALEAFLQAHPTKKQTQKALIANQPAPAALSIPDDACHYSEDELRVLTVREMARIQTFPDRFVFRSKVTTGGQMRKIEVPQYTQVGNAVPPLLGVAIGRVIRSLL